MRDEDSMLGPASSDETLNGDQAGRMAARQANDALGKQQFEKAVEHIDRALSFKPNDPRLLVTRGLALRRLGNLEAAEKDFHNAIRREERNARAHCALGALLRQVGRTGEAEKSLQRALEIDPSSIDARITLGRLYEHIGSAGMARRQYEAAIESNLHDERPYVALAALLISQGKLGVAKGCLGSARERNPGSAPALYWLAAIAAREGKTDQAAKLVEESVKAGLRDWRLLDSGSEFVEQRNTPRFQALLKLMKQGGSNHLFEDAETFTVGDGSPDVKL